MRHCARALQWQTFIYYWGLSQYALYTSTVSRCAKREIFWRARISIVHATMHTFFIKIDALSIFHLSLSLHIIVGCNVRFLNEITSIVQIAQVILFSPWFSLNIMLHSLSITFSTHTRWRIEIYNTIFFLRQNWFLFFTVRNCSNKKKSLSQKQRGWRQIKYSQ